MQHLISEEEPHIITNPSMITASTKGQLNHKARLTAFIVHQAFPVLLAQSSFDESPWARMQPTLRAMDLVRGRAPT